MAGVALLLAAGAPVRADDAGAEAYRRVCAECHANAAVVARRFASLAPEARRQRWETFLARHHGGDAEQRASLILYLEGAAAPPR